MHSVTIQVTDDYLRRATVLAAQHGLGLEAFIAQAVVTVVTETERIEFLRSRVENASKEEFDAVMNKVREMDTPPDPGDEMPNLQ